MLRYIPFYIITQVILTFWLVLAYDLFKDRCMHDWRHNYKIFLRFKMAESFENLDNILHDWEKDKNKKSIDKDIEQVREA